MAAEEAVLGLDTSCYTTSAALMDLHGHLLGDQRRLLRVKPGHRGLAQSEMVFQHTRNLPDLLEALDLSGVQVKAIGVSAKPRPREESYMPAFLVGLGMARSLGKLMGLPVHRFTHQHNHMFAGLWSVGKPAPDRFLLVHISGNPGAPASTSMQASSSTGWGWPWACPFRRGPRWKNWRRPLRKPIP
ncbi:hypothetical protein [uncultured Acidaminococcus sp.]|uniref:hypothetical protein n=1 Tax=uncultured Acidaminococcus sp. TaxID=352152 RepID=UPI002587D55E|nr:hypothetical protein [uncultured Acidaminococcus sp.]